MFTLLMLQTMPFEFIILVGLLLDLLWLWKKSPRLELVVE